LQYYESGENRNSCLSDGVDLYHPTERQAYIGVEWFSHFRAVFFEFLCVGERLKRDDGLAILELLSLNGVLGKRD
jgi:hypothetical protein